MSKTFRTTLAIVPFLLVVACTDAAKAPAEAALAAAGTAIESLKGDAARFAPEAVKTVQASYDSAKALVTKQDYKGALAAAAEIPAQAKAALAAASLAKDNAANAWRGFSENVQQSITEVTARVAALSSAKKLPRGIDKDAVALARQEVEILENRWQMVKDAASKGDYPIAIAKGAEVKKKAMALAASLAGK
ncbi:MAG: hypothetical protein WCS72_05895 [Deltaproteobacteria bacterium]